MRDGPDPAVLATSAEWRVVVSSWQGDDLRAEALPVVSGTWSADATQQVPEQLTITVPTGAYAEWIPGTDTTHPLARYGQVLDVSIIVSSADGQRTWETQIGRAGIQGWSAADPGDVSVEAVGVLQRVADDRLPEPTSPSVGSTFFSEFRRLLSGGIPVDLDPAVIDRVVPGDFVWQEDRLSALYDLADAWPVQIHVDPDGALRLTAPLSPVVPAAVMTFKDGEGGTIVSAPRSDTRADVYNAVVARANTSEPNLPTVQAHAQLTSGPMSVDGPYGPVRRFYSSPLLDSYEQCVAAANSVLLTSVLPSRTVVVTHAADPRVELYDPVRAIRDGVIYDGYVVAYSLPLTVADGEATTTIGIGAVVTQ
jgi:hypothetical protein